MNLTESKVEQVIQVAKTKALDSNFASNGFKSRSKSKNKMRSINSYSYKNIPPSSPLTPLTNANGPFTTRAT